MPEQLPTLPKRPAAFDPDPKIYGGADPLFARAVRGLMASNPGLKRQVNTISLGPNEEVGNYMRDQRDATKAETFPYPDQFARSTLAGLYHRDTKNIAISPDLNMDTKFTPPITAKGAPSMLQALVHELAHAKGEREIGASASEVLLEPSYDGALEALKNYQPLRYRLRTLGDF